MSGKPRIIITCRSLTGQLTGIGHYTLQLLKAMAADPPPDLAISFLWNRRHNSEHLDSGVFRSLGCEVQDSHYFWKYAPVEFPVLRAYDIIHAPDYIPHAFHGKKIVSIHDLSHIRYPQFHPRRRVLLLKAFQSRMIGAEHIITVSEYSKAEIMEEWKLPAERITVTLEATGEQFRPMELSADERDIIRRKYRLPEQYLLYVGTLEPRKNIERLVEAFALFCRENPGNDLQLVLAGGLGWLYQAMLHRIAELKLGDRIVMTGYVDREDLPLIYNMALAFIYPSLYEGFGLPPLEAMACGLPVIGSNTTSVPEVVGDAGLLVDPLDVEAIAAAIQRLVDSSSLREELSQKALDRAAQFSWQRCAAETVEVYRRV